MEDRCPVVRWTGPARRDLREIVEYTARDSPRAASHLADVFLGTADTLSILPRRGRAVPHPRRSDIREVFVFSYRLMYRADDDVVTILAVIHGARDLPTDALPDP